MKLYFHHLNVGRLQIQYEGWSVLMTVQLCPIKSKLLSQHCQGISVSKDHLSHSFQWLMYASTMDEI